MAQKVEESAGHKVKFIPILEYFLNIPLPCAKRIKLHLVTTFKYI